MNGSNQRGKVVFVGLLKTLHKPLAILGWLGCGLKLVLSFDLFPIYRSNAGGVFASSLSDRGWGKTTVAGKPSRWPPGGRTGDLVFGTSGVFFLFFKLVLLGLSKRLFEDFFVFSRVLQQIQVGKRNGTLAIP